MAMLTSKQVLTSQPHTARVLERQRSSTNFVNHSTKKRRRRISACHNSSVLM
ncbi:hypothetical protein J3E69DRAFT_338889 [Trichoderma sp. SZMC 28015]